MNIISPMAFVDPEAKLGDNNVIGPFCFIDKNVVIGNNNKLYNSVTIHTNGFNAAARRQLTDKAVIIASTSSSLIPFSFT